MKLSLVKAMYEEEDVLAEDTAFRGFNIAVAGTKYDPDKSGMINTAEIAYKATKWALKKATSKAMTKLLEHADPNVRRIIQKARQFAKTREQAASVILSGDGYYSLFKSIYTSGDATKKANLSRCLGIFKDPLGRTVEPDPPLTLIKKGCEELKIAAAIAVYREMEQTISYQYNPRLREAISDSTLASVQKDMGEYGGKIEFDLLEDDEIRPIVRARKKAEDIYQDEILAGNRPVFRYMGDITFRVATRGGNPTAIDLCPSTTHPITEMRSRVLRLPILSEAAPVQDARGPKRARVFKRPEREMGAAPEAPRAAAPASLASVPTADSIDGALKAFAATYPHIVERIAIPPDMYAAVRAAGNIMSAAKAGGFGRMEFFFPDDKGIPGKKSTNLDTQGSIGVPRIVAGVVRGYFTGARPDNVPVDVLRLIAAQLAPNLTVTDTGDVVPVDGPSLRVLVTEQGFGSSRSVLNNEDSARALLLIMYHLSHLASGTVKAKRPDAMRGRLASISPTAQFDLALANMLNLAQMATLYPDMPGFEKSPKLDLAGEMPGTLQRIRAALTTPGGLAARRRAYRTGGENVIYRMEPTTLPYVDFPVEAEEDERQMIKPPMPVSEEEVKHAERSIQIVKTIRDVIRDAIKTSGELIKSSSRLARPLEAANNAGQGGFIPAMAYTQRVDQILRADRETGAAYAIGQIGYTVPGRLCFGDPGGELGRRVWDTVRQTQVIKDDVTAAYDYKTQFLAWRDIFAVPKFRNATARTFQVITLDHYAYPVFMALVQILDEYVRADMISSEQRDILQKSLVGSLSEIIRAARARDVKTHRELLVDYSSLTKAQIAIARRVGAASAVAVEGVTPAALKGNPVTIVKIADDAPRAIDYRGLQLSLMTGSDAPSGGSGATDEPPPSEPPSGTPGTATGGGAPGTSTAGTPPEPTTRITFGTDVKYDGFYDADGTKKTSHRFSRDRTYEVSVGVIDSATGEESTRVHVSPVTVPVDEGEGAHTQATLVTLLKEGKIGEIPLQGPSFTVHFGDDAETIALSGDVNVEGLVDEVIKQVLEGTLRTSMPTDYSVVVSLRV